MSNFNKTVYSMDRGGVMIANQRMSSVHVKGVESIVALALSGVFASGLAVGETLLSDNTSVQEVRNQFYNLNGFDLTVTDAVEGRAGQTTTIEGAGDLIINKTGDIAQTDYNAIYANADGSNYATASSVVIDIDGDIRNKDQESVLNSIMFRTMGGTISAAANNIYVVNMTDGVGADAGLGKDGKIDLSAVDDISIHTNGGFNVWARADSANGGEGTTSSVMMTAKNIQLTSENSEHAVVSVLGKDFAHDSNIDIKAEENLIVYNLISQSQIGQAVYVENASTGSKVASVALSSGNFVSITGDIAAQGLSTVRIEAPTVNLQGGVSASDGADVHLAIGNGKFDINEQVKSRGDSSLVDITLDQGAIVINSSDYAAGDQNVFRADQGGSIKVSGTGDVILQDHDGKYANMFLAIRDSSATNPGHIQIELDGTIRTADGYDHEEDVTLFKAWGGDITVTAQGIDVSGLDVVFLSDSIEDSKNSSLIVEAQNINANAKTVVKSTTTNTVSLTADAITLQGDVELDGMLQVNVGQDAELSGGKVFGQGELVKTGAGEMVVNSSMADFTGSLKVDGGVFALNVGDGLQMSAVTIEADGALRLMDVSKSGTYDLVAENGQISADDGAFLFDNAFLTATVEENQVVVSSNDDVFTEAGGAFEAVLGASDAAQTAANMQALYERGASQKESDILAALTAMFAPKTSESAPEVSMLRNGTTPTADEIAMAKAFRQATGGSVTAGAFNVAYDAQSQVTDAITRHQLANHGHMGAWADVFATTNSADTLYGSSGYETDIYGGVFGFDATFSCGATAGVAVTVGTADTDTVGVLKNNLDTDFYGVSLYAVKDMAGLNVKADIGYMQFDNSFSGLGDAGDVDALTIGLRGDYKAYAGDIFSVTPHFGLRYTHLDGDKVAFDLGDGKTMNIFEAPVGVAVSGAFQTAGWTVVPAADFTIVPQLGDKDVDTFTGTVDVIDNLYNTTVGVGAQNGNLSFGLNYRYGFGDGDRDNHSLNANVRYAF